MNNQLFKIAIISAALSLASLLPARAQMAAGTRATPMGYCQISASSLGSATGLSACVAATFTGTCSGSTLTASSVTGAINVGWTITGTGIPSGAIVAAKGTGTGGAGTYTLSAACTASSASLSAVGPPVGATFATFQAETQNIRFRDDGAAPSTTVGQILIQGQPPTSYTGTMTALSFIDATAGGLLDASFYKVP